ncbi:MAG: hypothetical protein KatS3mg102_2121 [Planctomycetota bacterium]|nr:MAG: hypothetical protein KatS3mg102_2121 [Planctomycetota bacterium]
MKHREPAPAGRVWEGAAITTATRRALIAVPLTCLLAAVALLALFPAQVCQPFASEGAYLQHVTGSEATVAVLTEQPRRLRLEIRPEGAAQGEPLFTAEEPAPVRVHGLRARGLVPDTRYAYAVRDEQGSLLAAGTLRTAPPPGRRTVVFAALGDSGGVANEHALALPAWARRLIGRADDDRQQGVLATAIAHQVRPDFVLHTGDVVYPDGERCRYREAFFLPFAPLLQSAPLYPVLGNHDARTEGGAPLLEAFELPVNDADRTERFYSFQWGQVHVAALDSTRNDEDYLAAQARWLDRDLAAAAGSWRVVFMHHPPFSRGKYRGQPLLRAHIVPVLERHRVHLVLSGHDHNYQRFAPIGGVTYVVTGGGGVKLYPVEPGEGLVAWAVAYHYVVAEAGESVLQVRAVGIDGRELDRFSIAR